MSKLNNININIFAALKVSEMSNVPVLLMSNPGLGKSTTVEMFAKTRGYHLQQLRGNSTSPEEVMGYDVAPTNIELKESDNKVSEGTAIHDSGSTTKHLRPSWFTKLLEKDAQGIPTLLFLDEITTATVYVQSALLHLVFERRVGDENLPDSTLIVSAGNYAANLSNQMGLLPPLMNRFLIYNIEPKVEDIDTFLCRYEGSITGNRKNYMKELADMMTEMDNQEIKVSDEHLAKIGEYYENVTKMTTKMLMTTGERVVDLNVKDLQDLYSDADDDSKLCGFITLRTLNYVRDVTIAMYMCFGKEGIYSDSFRNMVDGLVGFGIKRSSNKSIVKTYITDHYIKAFQNVTNDIERLACTSLDVHTEFFTKMADAKSKDYTDETETFVAITNKVHALVNDKSVASIDRPIDEAIIKEIFAKMKKSSVVIAKAGNFDPNQDPSTISKDDVVNYAGIVTHWNSFVEAVSALKSLTTDPTRNYSASFLRDVVDKYVGQISKSSFIMKTRRRLYVEADAAFGNLIPDVKICQ